MMFRNMEALGATSVNEVVKVGDTVSDIKEGLAAGVFTVAVVEGSSEMAKTQEEFEALDAAAQNEACDKVAQKFYAAGAHAVIRTMAELPALVRQMA